MRRKRVSPEQLMTLQADLQTTYDLRSYEVDAGPKVLRITGPSGSSLARATSRSSSAQRESSELLHGRDGLAPSPETTSRLAPSWGDLWPSARAMAAYFGHAVRMRSVDAIEIGCGIGTAGLGAAAKGARVLLTDSNTEALKFAKYNALQNGFSHIQTMEFDWKLDRLRGLVGSLIFADVLHDPDNFDHVFRMLEDHLTPGRTAFLAEPGRPVAAGFFEELRKTDYRIRLDVERVEDDENYYLVSVLRIKKER